MLTSLARRLLFAVGVAAASPAALASVPSSDEPLASDAYTYDTVTGRLVTWPSTGPELGLPNDPEHEGAATYTYGPNNALVVRTDGSDAKFYFEELSYDTETGTAIYDVLPMLRVRGDELLWAFVEPDGHPFALSDEDGAWVSVEVAGAFGRPIAKLGTWDEESLHGSELDRDRRLTQMGVRHVSHADGRWLQPEPLLATGLVPELVALPTNVGPVYAGGSPLVQSDRSGNNPVVVAVEAAATLYDAYDVGSTALAWWRGEATNTELAVSVVGAAAGLLAPGGGYKHAVGGMVESAQATDKAVDLARGAANVGEGAGDAAKAAPSPSAARREAMRDAGIPTSQQPVSQRSVTTYGAEGEIHAGRQYDYVMPAPGGGTQQMSVQHSLTDSVPGHGAHWEAGKVKDAGQVDSLGRPRLQSDKAKVDE